MVLILALLAMLIIAVVVYAGFFLVFKLGWIIAGKKRNKWPLILAGLATVLLFAVVVGALIFGTNKYVLPVMELVDKTAQKTTLTTGVRPYTDPKYGFTINLAGGTEMSKWIKYKKNQDLLIGLDTNMGILLRQQKQQPSKDRQLPPMSALIIAVDKRKPVQDVTKFLNYQANKFIKASGTNYTVTAEPDYSIPNTVFMQGKGEADGQPFVIYNLATVQGDLQYRIWAPANGNPAYLQMVKDEIRSFRPAGVPPAPLASQAPAPLPVRENLPFPPILGLERIINKHK